ncbi:MAG: hypothetical protein H6812_04600 [Phycisphaeraceae bacterium]|nr:hypothetical protein [Phycisphaeraceae bacterium]
MNENRDLLSKYRARSAANGAAPQAPNPHPEEVGDGDPGGHIQRERHQIMLTLETRDGLSTALAYSYLSTIRFDPRGALELDFAGSTIAVRGVNLKPLFDGLRTHTTATIAESRGTAPRDPSEPFVEVIIIGIDANKDGGGHLAV